MMILTSKIICKVKKKTNTSTLFFYELLRNLEALYDKSDKMCFIFPNAHDNIVIDLDD